MSGLHLRSQLGGVSGDKGHSLQYVITSRIQRPALSPLPFSSDPGASPISSSFLYQHNGNTNSILRWKMTTIVVSISDSPQRSPAAL